MYSPRMFMPHPNLADEVNAGIAQSEIEGGVYLYEVPMDAQLEIETQNHYYTVVNCGEGEVLISGHPVYCPEPTAVRIAGSTWGGSMLKMSFIGRGMHLEFRHPDHKRPIVTSRIREIREVPLGAPRPARDSQPALPN